MTTAYPLAWPKGWPRTEASKRERWPAPKPPPLQTALDEMKKELRLLGVEHVTLSSNVTLGAEAPADPGVVAYGVYDKQEIAIPCDRWNTVGGNLRAIAKTIEAMRGMQRWGAKHMIRAMFHGFVALPAAGPGQQHWREVLGIAAGTKVDATLIEHRRRALAMQHHPDRPGGSQEAMAKINAAADEALREIG